MLGRKTIVGTITKWTEPKNGISAKNKAWAKISCEVTDSEGIAMWHSIFASPGELEAGTYQANFANIVTTMPQGSHIQFDSNLGEFNGDINGRVIKGTMKILAEAPAKSNSGSPAAILQAKLGKKADGVETAGKIRMHVSIAFIKQGAILHEGTIKDINQWTDFIMTGKEKPKLMPITEPVTKEIEPKVDEPAIVEEEVIEY